jgi:hypothetical protein
MVIIKILAIKTQIKNGNSLARATNPSAVFKAGLLDEIHLHLVPVLLGEGIRLFDHLGTEQVELESMRVIESPGATHLSYRAVQEGANRV